MNGNRYADIVGPGRTARQSPSDRRVNGDGRANLVGFGIAGTYVAYGQADGTFSAAEFDVANFGVNQGWT